MYCVCLRRWARHQQPAKYPCAAMTQQPASTYTLRRADCSTIGCTVPLFEGLIAFQGFEDTFDVLPLDLSTFRSEPFIEYIILFKRMAFNAVDTLLVRSGA